jgi:hypothetical protein
MKHTNKMIGLVLELFREMVPFCPTAMFLYFLALSTSALANPVTVTNLFHYRLTQSENDVNVIPADIDNSRLFFGANADPNGFANPPTTGVATQGSTTRNLNFDHSP